MGHGKAVAKPGMIPQLAQKFRDRRFEHRPKHVAGRTEHGHGSVHVGQPFLAVPRHPKPPIKLPNLGMTVVVEQQIKPHALAFQAHQFLVQGLIHTKMRRPAGLGQQAVHVRRAKDVTHRLLGFARRLEPTQEDIDVNLLLDQTRSFLENEANFRGIVFVSDYQKDLPRIESDMSQLQQVFLNILDNAIDAIDKNGTITVTTRSLVESGEVDITIADTGKGISKETLEKVFDPFFTTKKVGEGTGLGLTISYSIIEKLGGHITVQSEEGKGTAFHITLPVGS